MKLKEWSVLLGFASAIGGLVTLLITFIVAYDYNCTITIYMNNYGEWGIEVLLISASIVFVIYGLVGYMSKVGGK